MSLPILTIAAVPYCTESKFFTFSDNDEFEMLFNKQFNLRGTEEYSFDLIEADETAAIIWKLMEVTQANLHTFFEVYDSYQFDNDESLLKFKICIEHFGMTIDQAFQSYEDVCLFEGTPEEYVEQYYDEHYNVPFHIANYIDFKRMSQDWEYASEIIHFKEEGYVLTNPHGI